MNNTAKLKAARERYDASLETFRAASREYRLATEAYRRRETNDDVFLAARAKFKAAEEKADAEERLYIEAENANA